MEQVDLAVGAGSDPARLRHAHDDVVVEATDAAGDIDGESELIPVDAVGSHQLLQRRPGVGEPFEDVDRTAVRARRLDIVEGCTDHQQIAIQRHRLAKVTGVAGGDRCRRMEHRLFSRHHQLGIGQLNESEYQQ